MRRGLYAPIALAAPYPVFLRPPRQTVRRVFPSTAFRRPSLRAYQQPLPLIHRFGPRGVPVTPASPAFPPPVSPPVGDCLASAGQSDEMGHGLLRMFIALPATAGALMHPSPFADMVEAWPHARGRFCCPARHHFRATPTSPTPVTPALPVSSNLACAYRRRIAAGAWGSQVRSPFALPACR